jgi:UDP-glucose:(heptosyl)LPS alpha-1,3-glucosyltransferase
VIYNGVDLARYHPDNRARYRAQARAEVAAPADAWLALFAGSGFERKGLMTAVEALARLGDTRARLLVLGKGDVRPYQAMAERLGVAARVTWLGPRPDIERWYAAADALVLPTRYEPFGNVHLEALASGLPVVTTTQAGGAEAVNPACGAVVEPRDPAALAAALERLRAMDRSDLTAASRAAAELFTYARQVSEFEAIYRRISLKNR